MKLNINIKLIIIWIFNNPNKWISFILKLFIIIIIIMKLNINIKIIIILFNYSFVFHQLALGNPSLTLTHL